MGSVLDLANQRAYIEYTQTLRQQGTLTLLTG